LLAGFACAVSVARRGEAGAPKVVDIFLAFDHTDDDAGGDRLGCLVAAVEDGGVDAARAFAPAGPVRLLEPETRLGAGKIGHLAKTRRAAGLAVLVGCQLKPGRAVELRVGALLGPGPATMIAAPARRAVRFDCHAENFGLAVLGGLSVARAPRTSRV